jgi:hypothetical protein
MLPSFAAASDALAVLAVADVSAKRVEWRVKEIGTARCGERDAEAEADLGLPLAERTGTPAGVAAPDRAVVQMDGGRHTPPAHAVTAAELPRWRSPPNRKPCRAPASRGRPADGPRRRSGHGG